jgi:single-stranded-DNA-specific exonuclease
MLKAKARWIMGQGNEQLVEEWANTFSISPMLARLLVVRGMTDKQHVEDFLYGGTDLTHDPFLLDGMAAAVERIRRALEAGERIRIYGDYDADGVSSTALMVHLLRQMPCTFDYYIPHRVHEGYGLNKGAIDKAKEAGVSLLITVDTGISAVEQIAYANSLGLDVIVTDHHEPPEQLPEAYALINPKKPNCPYPFKQLAGVGVALKLAQALLGRWPEELVEYAAIGTIADLMLLQGENRIIVKQGLKALRSTSNAGIKALLGVADIPVREVNSTHIGFAIAPRINASGRLEKADAAVQLLITESEQEAEMLAYELDALNKERQKLVEEMTKQAVAHVEQKKQQTGELPPVIVVAHEGWNVGVIGIVASKLVDRFYRPTLVLGIDKETGMAKGSARSIAGYDLYQALSRCHDLMDHFGGHTMAAGMTLAQEHLPELERRLGLLAEEWLAPEDWLPLLKADLECKLHELTLDGISQLELLGPFGMGNPSPKFVFQDLVLSDVRTMGKEQQHVKLSLRSASHNEAPPVDAVGFGKGGVIDWLSPAAPVEVLGELSINEWNGVRKPQIMLSDLRVQQVQIFDWRGHAKPEAKVAELCTRLRSPLWGEAADIPAVVLFSELRLPEALRRCAEPYALWGMDERDQLVPLNEYARERSIAQASDIVLYALPDSTDQLKKLAQEAEAVERYYAAFGGSEPERDAGVVPGRDAFKSVYGALSSLGSKEDRSYAPAAFVQGLSKRSGLSPASIQFILDVFEELGFVNRTEAGYRMVPAPPKQDLTASRTYRRRQSRSETEHQLLYCSAKDLTSWLVVHTSDTHSMLEGIR